MPSSNKARPIWHPSEFVEVVEKDSGRVYYWNTQNGDVTWQAPFLATEPSNEPPPNIDDELEGGVVKRIRPHIKSYLVPGLIVGSNMVTIDYCGGRSAHQEDLQLLRRSSR